MPKQEVLPPGHWSATEIERHFGATPPKENQSIIGYKVLHGDEPMMPPQYEDNHV